MLSSMTAFAVGVFLALNIVSATTLANPELQCHEFAVVIVSAIDHAFPEPTCNQLRYPAEYCLKEAVTSKIEVIDNANGQPNCLNSERTSVHEARANFRGQTSLFFPKHQFNVQFSEPSTFVGMPEDKKFVLNGPFLDCSLMRNHLAHWLYRSTGRYSPRTRHVAMYFSSVPGAPPRYVGIYLVLEKLGYGPNRVGLSSLDSSCRGDDLSGGWAWHNDPASFGDFSPNMVIDQYQNEFGMGERPVLAYPSGSSTSQLMRDYFVNTSQGFLPQMYRNLWNNMTNPESLESHLDLGSFADYILHTEMSLNVDAYRRSTYFFKDRGETINAGPVWDFNLAYGNGARWNYTNWIFPQYTYWKRLMCNYKLTSYTIQRWKAMRADNQPWSDESIIRFLNDSAAPVHRQLTKCTGDWRSDVPQCIYVNLQTCPTTYSSAITTMVAAVLGRAHWMDQHIYELYKPLNATLCSGVGDIPHFNCGPNGNDSGCLTDPERYYKNVTFPPIRKAAPKTSSRCAFSTLENDKTMTLAEQHAISEYSSPSLDFCWLASGATSIYPEQKGVREVNMTGFCGGYGKCEQGPRAACVCKPGVKVHPTSCYRLDLETDRAMATLLQKPQHGNSKPQNWTPTLWHAVVAVGVLGVVAMAVIAMRRARMRQRLNVFRPVHYGSVDAQRYFSTTEL